MRAQSGDQHDLKLLGQIDVPGQETNTIVGVYKRLLVNDPPNNFLICHSERSEESSPSSS